MSIAQSIFCNYPAKFESNDPEMPTCLGLPSYHQTIVSDSNWKQIVSDSFIDCEIIFSSFLFEKQKTGELHVRCSNKLKKVKLIATFFLYIILTFCC